MIELGKVYRDRITGFIGTATAHLENLYDGKQVKLVPTTGPIADPKEQWFSVERVECFDGATMTGFNS